MKHIWQIQQRYISIIFKIYLLILEILKGNFNKLDTYICNMGVRVLILSLWEAARD